MPPLTSAQKGAVSNFVAITGTTERTATKYLKNTSYKLNEAVDAYFQTTGGGSSASSHNRDAQLNKVFDSFRNDKEDAKDTLGADSSMAYLQSIGAGLDDASLFLALELIQAPSIGEITREGFVKGWKSTTAEPKREGQKAHFRHLLDKLSTDRELFRKVYRYAFVCGKEADQKALKLDNAIIFWDMLFKKPGHPWVGGTEETAWLKEWKIFLAEKWTRSVSRDMWNQTLEFAVKSIEDESLDFWTEDGAWPGVIDEFVAWYKGKSEMDVDA